jgi:N-acetylglucosamine kinase-like BadF-type ATPase
MLLIADSGSTKTQWLTADKKLFETEGLNPHFHTAESVKAALEKNRELCDQSSKISTIYFYGAGCSSEERNNIVLQGLQTIFPSAQIHIDHDLKAAAYATYNGTPGIACILGTGSNSCFFDGTHISEVVPSLGYALGDEGSGSWYGKHLVRLYLYHKLPPATQAVFETHFPVQKEEIFRRIYKEPFPNTYLASFAPILTLSPDKEFIHELVKDGFREFFKYHVACYEGYPKYKIHFVGSMAYHFRPILDEVAAEFDTAIGTVDKQPVYNLLAWHLKGENAVNA